MQVRGERAGGHGELAHAALEEVAAQRRLREAHELRTRLERDGLGEQFADAREIAVVVALPRLELGERERDEGRHAMEAHWRAGCEGNRSRTAVQRRVVGVGHRGRTQ